MVQNSSPEFPTFNLSESVMFNNDNSLQEIKVISNSSKHDVQDLPFSTQTQGLSAVKELTHETRQFQHFFDDELDQIF